MTRIQREIVRAAFRLAFAYPKTDLDNPPRALDDLIYIILSGQTSEINYQRAYATLRARYPDWEAARRAPARSIERAIRGAGLSVQKARYIKAILARVHADFGETSLDGLADWPTGDAETYLRRLPGVGVKTARCVLLYTLGRDVFPADVHCLRIMERAGWLKRGKRRMEDVADAAQALVLPAIRRELHISLVQHGRAVCKPVRPECRRCCIAECCRWGKKSR
ncbi:MAG: endonuclease III [Candidatus Hydrogenedentes bacterium]|nr:endonuclease III [Candidatus Hydrogenedentota bacterium]